MAVNFLTNRLLKEAEERHEEEMREAWRDLKRRPLGYYKRQRIATTSRSQESQGPQSKPRHQSRRHYRQLIRLLFESLIKTVP